MKGLTLIEILIVLGIIVILAAIGYTGYGHWIKKQKVEKDTRTLYIQLLETRIKAFTQKKVCGIVWNNTNFSEIYFRCDTDSDGDITDTDGYEELGTFKLNTKFTSNFSNLYLRFTPEGFTKDWGTFYSTETDVNPEYNCITVSLTQIRMGHWNGTSCEIR